MSADIQIKDGFIYGKFIEIKLSSLPEDFSFSPTKLTGLLNSFEVSQSPQSGGQANRLDVSEVWVNGGSILLVLDEKDADFPSWNDATLRDNKFTISLPSVANFTVGSSNFVLSETTPVTLDKVLSFQSGGSNTFNQGLPFSGLDTDAQQILTASIDDDAVGSALIENFATGDIGGSKLYVTQGSSAQLEFVRVVQNRTTQVDSFDLSGSDLNPAFEQYVKALAPYASHVQLVQETDIGFTSTELDKALAIYTPDASDPTKAELLTKLQAWNPGNLQSLTFSVEAANTSLVKFSATGHGLKTGDAFMAFDSAWDLPPTFGGITDTQALRAVKDAFSGLHSVTVVDTNTFTIEVDYAFTGPITSQNFSDLGFTDVKLGLNIDAFQTDLAEHLIDAINDETSNGTTGTYQYQEALRAYAEGDTSLTTHIPLYDVNITSLLKANGYLGDGTGGTTSDFHVTSEFGLVPLSSGVTGSAMTPSTAGALNTQSALTGGLLSQISITGAGADEWIFAGGSYTADGANPPRQTVNGGSGIDTLMLLGNSSDYAFFGQAQTTIPVSSVSIDHSHDTVTVVVSGSPLVDLTQGDWISWTPPVGTVIGGLNFATAPVEAGLFRVVDVTDENGIQRFTFDVSSVHDFTTSDGADNADFSTLHFYDAIPVIGSTYSLPNTTTPSFVVGLSQNSYTATSPFLSTVIDTTNLSVEMIEKVQFVDWPFSPITTGGGVLGVVPMEYYSVDSDILTTKFDSSSGNTSNALAGDFKILDISAEKAAYVDLAYGGFDTNGTKVDTPTVFTFSGDSTTIGSFDGYLLNAAHETTGAAGSEVTEGTLFVGLDDTSELVLLKGDGKAVTIEFGDRAEAIGGTAPTYGTELDTLGFVGRTNGVSVDLSAGTFSSGSNLGGTVTGAEGVIGTTFADNIMGHSDQTNFLSGAGGADTITGGSKSDLLIGGAGSKIDSGGGDDTIIHWDKGSVETVSTLTGGQGSDTFYLLDDDITSSVVISDFAYGQDGASRPGRAGSAWEDRVALGISASQLTALGFTASTIAGQSLSLGDYEILRSKIEFKKDPDDHGTATSIDDTITWTVGFKADTNGNYSSSGTFKELTSFTVNWGRAESTEGVEAHSIAPSSMSLDFDQDLVGDMFKFRDLEFLNNEADGTSDYVGSSTQIRDEISDVGTPPGIEQYSIADNFVFLYVGLELINEAVVRPQFPPNPADEGKALLVGRRDATTNESLTTTFESVNSDDTFVGGRKADTYKFVAEVFRDSDTSPVLSPRQSFGKDIVIERGAPTIQGTIEETNRDAIDAGLSVHVSDAIFTRTELGREGDISLNVHWDEVRGNSSELLMNAGDITVFRQYYAVSDRFRVEDVKLGGVTFDLGVVKAGGAELHTSDARDAILVGRDNGPDTFVVNAGTAIGPQTFDLHLWGLDESDTLRFEGMGALTSFVAQGSKQNGDYIEHSAVLTFVGVDDGDSTTTDDSWTVNATFHQDSDATPRDFDFMTLVVDPDGKVDGADNGSNGTYPVNLDAKNLILFDDTRDAAGLYEFDLDRQEAMQEAGLSFDGETIDIYLLDGGAASKNDVTLIGFMGETTDKDSSSETNFVYEELKDAVYDASTLTASSITVVDDADVTVATASATFTTPSTVVKIITDTTDPLVVPAGDATATLNFVDEELEFLSFSDTGSSFSELELATVAAAP